MVKNNALRGPACLILAAALTAYSGMAIAAKPLTLRPGMTGVPDLGAIKCETFADMYPNGPTGMSQAVLTWAQGYFYGLTAKTTDEILAQLPEKSSWDFDTLTGHIIIFCEEHPEVPLPVAVKDLWSVMNADNRTER
ncbi:MAG: hypothetical protein QGH93_02825 [Gammaproteobacteria bacterium]|jgi:hypothetical protein|nr:hypothetical protein [Chromatiales bacterium]MDP6673776.1 hypothetical protein [Gammaproteobacteria bacterium]